jgi:hypothetical protein
VGVYVNSPRDAIDALAAELVGRGVEIGLDDLGRRCLSRDTARRLLARRLRRTVMVARTYPIRVQSPTNTTSGWMSQELAWEEIARRSQIPLEELVRTEKGSRSGKQRRVAEFDWHQLRRSVELNGATDIALTFTDYSESATARPVVMSSCCQRRYISLRRSSELVVYPRPCSSLALTHGASSIAEGGEPR